MRALASRTAACMLGAAALSIAVGVPSYAADCTAVRAGAPDQATALRRLLAEECLGGPSDTDPAVKPLRTSIDGIAAIDDADRWAAALYVLRSVGSRAETWTGLAVPDDCRSDLTKAFGAMQSELLKGAVVAAPTVTCGDNVLAPGCWDVDSKSFSVPALPHCGAFSSLPPKAGEEVSRVARLVHDALGGLLGPAVKKFHTAASEFAGRWWNYFFGTRAQYPWELWANASCFARRIRDEPGVAFHEPPRHQLIFLHPGLALEYLNDAPDGEQLKPAVSVELVGFNRWTWIGESPAKAFGASLVANYADIATIRDWRFGAAVHVRHRYSFGATRASGDTGYFASADLAQLFTDKRKTARSFIDKLAH